MKSKCCKAEARVSYGYEGTNHYVCTKCKNACDLVTPQKRCKTCGRFSKEDTCSRCLMIPKKEYKGMDFETLESLIRKGDEKPKSNHQIYTEMVEWMYFNDDEQSETAYRIDLLAKLKELLNV